MPLPVGIPLPLHSYPPSPLLKPPPTPTEEDATELARQRGAYCIYGGNCRKRPSNPNYIPHHGRSPPCYRIHVDQLSTERFCVELEHHLQTGNLPELIKQQRAFNGAEAQAKEHESKLNEQVKRQQGPVGQLVAQKECVRRLEAELLEQKTESDRRVREQRAEFDSQLDAQAHKQQVECVRRLEAAENRIRPTESPMRAAIRGKAAVADNRTRPTVTRVFPFPLHLSILGFSCCPSNMDGYIFSLAPLTTLLMGQSIVFLIVFQLRPPPHV